MSQYIMSTTMMVLLLLCFGLLLWLFVVMMHHRTTTITTTTIHTTLFRIDDDGNFHHHHHHHSPQQQLRSSSSTTSSSSSNTATTTIHYYPHTTTTTMIGHDDTDFKNCNYHDNTTTKQCFLFPKLTEITTITTTDYNRQLQQQQQNVTSSSTNFLNQNSSVLELANNDGIRLSSGLTATIIARTGERVLFNSPLAQQQRSRIPFHRNPDGADIFTIPEESDENGGGGGGGGYIYMSNAERLTPFTAGVYGIHFDKNHNIMDYVKKVRRTTRNCNGGRTPWDTWITCEEVFFLPLLGYCWQVDPLGKRPAQKITMTAGFKGGAFEAFAYDVRDDNNRVPSFYVTEDAEDGALRRYRPPTTYTNMDWDMLHQRNGITDYLELIPETMTFRWTTDISIGRQSATMYYRNNEGIAIHNGTLAFVSKNKRLLFLLDLDAMTYTAVSTTTPNSTSLPRGGSFDSGPDHVISHPDAPTTTTTTTMTTTTATQSNAGNILFISEDGGPTPGLFAYDGTEYFTVLEAELGKYDDDEVTGIAFSPDGTVMYACLQKAGILLQIKRDDQQPFRYRRTLKWRKGLKL